MKKNYENVISKLNNNLNDNKDQTQLLKQYEDKENYIKNIEEKYKKEKDELNAIIQQLKQINSTSENDQSELIKMNEILKQTIEELNDELEKTKEQLKYISKENKSLLRKNTHILEQNNEIKKSNDQLHGVVYGRFGKH